LITNQRLLHLRLTVRGYCTVIWHEYISVTLQSSCVKTTENLINTHSEARKTEIYGHTGYKNIKTLHTFCMIIVWYKMHDCVHWRRNDQYIRFEALIVC